MRTGIRYYYPLSHIFFTAYAGPELAVNLGYAYDLLSSISGTPVVSPDVSGNRYPGITSGVECYAGVMLPLFSG
ncbi:MAG: hypothetical protein ACOYXB_13395 [Bacteroidota bacterium]